MTGLDHVAILVSDLDAAIRLYRDVYGLTLAEVEEVPTEQVRVAIFGHGAGRIELISPSGPSSPMAKAIEKRGEGLHHVCLEVPDIVKAMSALKAGGAPLLDEEPRPGAGGAKVAFVHPKGSRGVLVELRQGPAAPEKA
jgi:methylmalonyl-CoA/ethylmalonyl-CoA epimerase